VISWELLNTDTISNFITLVCSGDSIVAGGVGENRSNYLIMSPVLGENWYDFKEGINNLNISQGAVIFDNGKLFGRVGGSLVMTRQFGVSSVSPDFDNRDVTIYPSFTRDIINIKLSNQDLFPAKAELINSLGQSMIQVEIKTSGVAQIDISTYLSGMYILQVYSAKYGQLKVQKILKY
jgi:hypothetical protein